MYIYIQKSARHTVSMINIIKHLGQCLPCRVSVNAVSQYHGYYQHCSNETLIPTAGLLWVSFPQCCHTCPGSIALWPRMNHTDKHGECEGQWLYIYSRCKRLHAFERRTLSKAVVPHVTTFKTMTGDLGIMQPLTQLVFGAQPLHYCWPWRPHFESERNLEMKHSSGRQTTRHMLRLQLCQPLFYTIHSFPSLVVSLQMSRILAKTRGSASGLKGDRAKSPAAADLSPDGADWRADTQMNTTPDCGEGARPEEDSPSPQPEEIRPVGLTSPCFLNVSFCKMELMFLPPGFQRQ